MTETAIQLQQLQGQVAMLKDQLAQLGKALVDHQQRINNRLINIEGDIAYLKMRVKGTKPGSETLSSFEARKKILQIIAELNDEKITVDEAFQGLKSYQKEAVPLIWGSLKDAKYRRAFDRLNRLEDLLTRVSPEYLYDHLEAWLKDPEAQIIAVRIVGTIGSKDLSKFLTLYINTTDPELRFCIGEALVKCKDKAGIPLLIDTLEYEIAGYNVIAFDILNKLTGKRFNYKIYKSAKQNREAIKAWRKWWTENGDTFEFQR
jgi:hypothetical protein